MKDPDQLPTILGAIGLLLLLAFFLYPVFTETHIKCLT